jgi:succinate dehydrogenase/fumarate reductase flavoprotein subunit
MEIGLTRFKEIRADLQMIFATNPHELMRAAEVGFILDCAEMAARASLFRTESRWGLYHHRQDYPERNDTEWHVHVQVKKSEDGVMTVFKRPLEPYLVEPDETEKTVYQQLRIQPKEAIS